MNKRVTTSEEIHRETQEEEEEEVLPARTILATLLSTVALGGLLSAAAYGLVLFIELGLRPEGQVPQREVPPRERACVCTEPFDLPHGVADVPTQVAATPSAR